MAMKKTLKSGFGRRPQQKLQVFSIFLLVWLESKLHTKKQSPSLLNFRDGYEEDPKIWIWKTTSTKIPSVLNISSSLVRIKLHTKNQSPSLLNFGDGYEEDPKIWIWKTTSKKFPTFLNNSSSLVRIKLHTNKQPPRLLNF